MPIGIFVIRPDGSPLYANRRAIEILGKGISSCPEDDKDLARVYQAYLGGTDSLYPPERIPIARALQGFSAHADDMVVRHPDRDIPLEVWASPVYGAGGKLEFAIAAFKDISARTAAAAALTASRDLFRGLVETTQAVPWELDPRTGRFLYIGPQAAVLFGYPIERWQSEPFFLSHVVPADRDGYLAQLSRAVAGESFENHYRGVTAAGRALVVRLVGNTISTPAGSLLRGFIFDVTAQASMELELRQAQKLESVGRLASGIAHEINTPAQFVSDNTVFLGSAFEKLVTVATAARGVAARAKAGDTSPASFAELDAALGKARLDYLTVQVPRAISQSIEGLGRIGSIVGAMKELSHPGSGAKEPLDIAHALETTLTVARHEWKYVATIETQFDPEMPSVPGLRDELNQVFLNLIVNAAHAIAEVVKDGSNGKGKITVSTQRAAGVCVVRIADTGAGIPDEIKGRLFDPFFTTKPVGKGTGQGLAVAYNVVVKKHQGQILVESAVGVGSVFEVRLPLQPSPPRG